MFGFLHKSEPAPTPPTAQERLQAEIEAEVGKLHVAQSSVLKAAELMRERSRARDVIADDVSTLTHRIEKGDESLKEKRERKYAELAAANSALDLATQMHKDGVASVQQFESAIRSIKSNAEELNIGLDLAKADESGSALAAEMKGYGTGAIPSAANDIQEQIRAARASATVNRSVSTDPNEARDADYLKAAKEGKN